MFGRILDESLFTKPRFVPLAFMLTWDVIRSEMLSSLQETSLDRAWHLRFRVGKPTPELKQKTLSINLSAVPTTQLFRSFTFHRNPTSFLSRPTTVL